MTRPARSEPTAAALGAVLDELLDAHSRSYPGLVMGVTVEGVEAKAATGRIGPEGPPPTAATSFEIGSVTKVFTALLLAEAAVRGEVAVDQKLASLLPDVAVHPRGRPITLLDLATHTAGLARLPHGVWWDGLRHSDDPYRSFTREKMADVVLRPPKNPPGTAFRYSNYGYGLLGEALARAGDEPFAGLVASRIAAPLSMTRTGVGGDDVDRAVGHTRRGKPTNDWDMGALAGAGALRSTVADLLVFLRAHVDPSASPLRGAVDMVLQTTSDAGSQRSLRMGWDVLEHPAGTSWWWHNGMTGGFASFVGFDPQRQVGVVVLANSSRSVDRLGMALLERV